MTEANEQIAQLYLHMYDFLLDYAQASLDSLSLAEEAVQETFEIACQKQDALFGSGYPEGWILDKLKGVIASIKKCRETDNSLLQRYITAYYRDFSVTEDPVRIEILYDDMAQMEELKLIKELVIDGCSYLEMARKRGISISACRKRVQRAREVLRKKLGK